jgi:hypothetical protein
VPPRVPDNTLKQFRDLLSELKKLGENVNLRNVGEVHDRFVRLRSRVMDIAYKHPQLIDEANEVVGKVGSAIRDASDRFYSVLAKAAGRDSFWRGDGDVKTSIGTYKYDPSTGAFLLSLYDRPTGENVVGYIKDDGTPVVIRRTRNMSEALEEYNKLLQKRPQAADGFTVVAQPPRPDRQAELLRPLRDAAGFLRGVLKAGAGFVSAASGKPKQAGGSEFIQPPSRHQIVLRPPDYVVVEEAARRSALNAAVRGSPDLRPVDYILLQADAGNSSAKAPAAVAPLAEERLPQERRQGVRGRPVAVAI